MPCRCSGTGAGLCASPSRLQEKEGPGPGPVGQVQSGPAGRRTAERPNQRPGMPFSPGCANGHCVQSCGRARGQRLTCNSSRVHGSGRAWRHEHPSLLPTRAPAAHLKAVHAELIAAEARSVQVEHHIARTHCGAQAQGAEPWPYSSRPLDLRHGSARSPSGVAQHRCQWAKLPTASRRIGAGTVSRATQQLGAQTGRSCLSSYA